MIRKSYPWLMFLVGVSFGLVASNRLILHAQAQRKPATPATNAPPAGPDADDARPANAPFVVADPATIPSPAADRPTASSVHDQLVRPYRFPFARPTSLLQVCNHLKQTLKVPVVLDIAAMGRQDVEPEDTVQLELEGVRLKTGLKLLLDQVRLTYHVVAEDNLLIITDREGAEEPLDRVRSELQAMHREIHDVQDTLDELTDYLAVEKDDGPRVRKPTIVEEMEEDAPRKDEDPPQKLEGAPKKRRGAEDSVPSPRSNSARVPLVGPGRPL